MKTFVIQAEHVMKRSEQTVILEDINLEISQNTKLAILGHNGSGKSSLLKLFAGLYAPTSGTLKIQANKVGYVPENFPENIRFKLGEYLLHMAILGGLDRKEAVKRTEDYSRLFHLEAHMDTWLKHCSKGTKQKAGIIQALMQNPDLLLLDEPLTGLDEESKKVFLDLLTDNERNMTLIFTAHEQETVDLLAEEIMILENGRIARHEAFTKYTKLKHITLRLPEDLDVESLKVYGKIVSIEKKVVEVTVPARSSDRFLLYALKSECSILEVRDELR
ncbi:MAG: ATP-binding cassette domain-containing protein [Bacillus sp. (in: firmicutes)]